MMSLSWHKYCIYVLQTRRQGYRQGEWNPPARCSQRNSRRLGEKNKTGYKTFSSSTRPLAIAAPPHSSHSSDVKRSSSSGGNARPLNRLNISHGDGSRGCLSRAMSASHLMFIYTFCVTEAKHRSRAYSLFLFLNLSTCLSVFFMYISCRTAANHSARWPCGITCTRGSSDTNS